jgi:hypothetical protein
VAPDEAAALGAASQAARLVMTGGEGGGGASSFNRDYKKSKDKLHKEVGGCGVVWGGVSDLTL